MNPEDPYTGLLLEMDRRAKGQQPPGLLRGTVLDVGEGRLVIRTGGMTLDEQDLMADPRLLPRKAAPRRVTVQLSRTDPTSAVTLDVGGKEVQTRINTGTSVISSIPLYTLPGTLLGELSGVVTWDSDWLAVGDQVLLLPDADEQVYYVLSKVVSP